MAKRLLGKEVNEALVAALQTRTAALREKGITLATITRVRTVNGIFKAIIHTTTLTMVIALEKICGIL